jgi:hypothetical protein
MALKSARTISTNNILKERDLNQLPSTPTSTNFNDDAILKTI